RSAAQQGAHETSLAVETAIPEVLAVEVVLDCGPLACTDLPKTLACVGRFEDAFGGRDGDELRIARMHCDRDRVSFQPSGTGRFPCLAVVQGEVQAGPGNPRARCGVPDIDRVGVPARA